MLLPFCLVFWKRTGHSVNHVMDNSVYRAEIGFAGSEKYKGVRGTVGRGRGVFFFFFLRGGGLKRINFG